MPSRALNTTMVTARRARRRACDSSGSPDHDCFLNAGRSQAAHPIPHHRWQVPSATRWPQSGRRVVDTSPKIQDRDRYQQSQNGTVRENQQNTASGGQTEYQRNQQRQYERPILTTDTVEAQIAATLIASQGLLVDFRYSPPIPLESCILPPRHFEM